MKAQNMKIFLISLILLFTQVYSLAYAQHELVHEDSQCPKPVVLENKDVCVISPIIGQNNVLENKDVCVISPIIGQNKALVTKFDKKGIEEFSDMSLNISDSGSGKAAAINEDVYFFGHNQQNLGNAKSNDILAKINHSVIINKTLVMPKPMIY